METNLSFEHISDLKSYVGNGVERVSGDEGKKKGGKSV